MLAKELSQGLEIKLREYKNDEVLQRIVKSSNIITEIRLKGTRNEHEDNELFEEVTRHCCRRITKIVFDSMIVNITADKLQMFPLLSKIVFCWSQIGDDSVLRFKDWCPNITTLVFHSTRLSDDAYTELCSTEHLFPHIKVFAFHFAFDTESDRVFLAAMDTKFPSIESLNLTFEREESFIADDCRVLVERLFFKNLKKLWIFSFGEHIEYLFEYLAISNKKLKELTFNGLMVPDKCLEWIQDCKKLSKLTFDCPFLIENDLNDFEVMPLLREVRLEVKQFHWQPEEMMEFIRKQPRLKVLDIDSDRKNSEMQYGQDFKKMFDDLVKQRKKLLIKAVFHQGSRQIKFSEKGFKETKMYATSSDDESDDKNINNNNVVTSQS